MRAINHHTIDEWLFDYFEGNLDSSEKEVLTAFLHRNPALKADYDTWKNSYVIEPEITYPVIDKLLMPEISLSAKLKAIAVVAAVCGLIAWVLMSIQPSSVKVLNPNPVNIHTETNPSFDTMIRVKVHEGRNTELVRSKEHSVIYTEVPDNGKEAQEPIENTLVPGTLFPRSVTGASVLFADSMTVDTLLNIKGEYNKLSGYAKDTLDDKGKKTKKKNKGIQLSNPGF